MIRAIATRILALGAVLAPTMCAGCTWLSYLGTTSDGAENGKTFYLGGAGPFGHVGTIDVPNGLRLAGYRGAIEVFGWQSWVPSTLRDQLDREKNQREAERLTRHICDYLDSYPGHRVNIVALSAGTGISTWALEALPAEYEVGTVVFLSSSLSRGYDLSTALRAVRGRLYNFYSTQDPVLRYGVTIAGTVDREFEGSNAAGLLGFAAPPGLSADNRFLYETHFRNMPYREHYAAYGYTGNHTDATNANFVRRFVAKLIMEPLPKRPAPMTPLPPVKPEPLTP